jgi:hypothetical protein
MVAWPDHSPNQAFLVGQRKARRTAVRNGEQASHLMLPVRANETANALQCDESPAFDVLVGAAWNCETNDSSDALHNPDHNDVCLGEARVFQRDL